MEWISITTRLPEPNDTVLIAADRFITIATWNAADQAFDMTSREDACIIVSQMVTHWMPLPELPEA